MVLCSKMDNVLLSGFEFDGNIKKYLLELDFEEARAVFMFRYRMTPTKGLMRGVASTDDVTGALLGG